MTIGGTYAEYDWYQGDDRTQATVVVTCEGASSVVAAADGLRGAGSIAALTTGQQLLVVGAPPKGRGGGQLAVQPGQKKRARGEPRSPQAARERGWVKGWFFFFFFFFFFSAGAGCRERCDRDSVSIEHADTRRGRRIRPSRVDGIWRRVLSGPRWRGAGESNITRATPIVLSICAWVRLESSEAARVAGTRRARQALRRRFSHPLGLPGRSRFARQLAHSEAEAAVTPAGHYVLEGGGPAAEARARQPRRDGESRNP